MTELRACPFCGGSVHLFKQISGWWVYCENRECLASTYFSRMHDPQEETVSRWNTRSYDSALTDIEVYADNISHVVDFLKGKCKR